MNMRISLLAALFWGILVISMSTGIVSAGSQAPRCTGVEACTGNTGTVAFGSCNGDLSCFSNTAPIAPDSCDDVATCFRNSGPIAPGSCSGGGACNSNLGAVGSKSCNGAACQQSCETPPLIIT